MVDLILNQEVRQRTFDDNSSSENMEELEMETFRRSSRMRVEEVLAN